jgi:hypothetical protein
MHTGRRIYAWSALDRVTYIHDHHIERRALVIREKGMSFEEEDTYMEDDTCIWGGGYMHMGRRIHAYGEEDMPGNP